MDRKLQAGPRRPDSGDENGRLWLRTLQPQRRRGEGQGFCGYRQAVREFIGSEVKVYGLGFSLVLRVSEFKAYGLGFSLVFRVQGLRFTVWGSGFRVAVYRVQEHGKWEWVDHDN